MKFGGIYSALLTMVLTCSAALQPAAPRTEYLPNPIGIDANPPRLSWRVESDARGDRQTAYRILAASSPEILARHEGDLWDSGKILSDQTLHILYRGKPLTSGQRCYWKVQVWDKDGNPSGWSEPAHWSMGLLTPEDWKAEWISFKDTSPVHKDRKNLFLPPARHYRKHFQAGKAVERATLYASALGIYEWHMNGARVGDAFFEPGWSDYIKRAYYRAHDVTSHLRHGTNALGAIVAEGWYSGYLGYGLLVGYGPYKSGRDFYGKTPAVLAQLEIEYTDGTRERIITDSSWQVSADGPIREADFLMGETFDARRDRTDWYFPDGAIEWKWEQAVFAEDNGSTKAPFFDNEGEREVELGFQKPTRMQAYSAPPIRITEELKARRITEPKPGAYIFDLGQNFAGTVRLKVKGPAGMKVQLRFGEMLHPDGRLMTENLRRARATDHYILRGDPEGETWEPRFTYHGYQFVEVTGLQSKPALEMITGLVLHNDTPLTGFFECSDEVMTKFWKNTVWTQRANFIEAPTDCPQRDERLGWMGDAQIYARTATYNADVAAFFTKWLDDVEESQRSFGAYPDYAPYPMGHGAPGQTWGTAWTDAGVICPWTIWHVYGDTRVIERHWASMTRFMEWRKRRAPDFKGRSDGNTWGDWLNVNEPTPIELIDAAYFKHTADLMALMARATGRDKEAGDYDQLQRRIIEQFARDYHNADGSLKVNTQTAHVLSLAFGLVTGTAAKERADRLAEMIAKNNHRMATGFLGTKWLLPALTEQGHHDLAVRLFQSRNFPSWGYAVVNGANTVWERWDSYTKEEGFGRHNAAMNSFSHYAFGAAMEWGFRALAGIDTADPGYKRILIRPGAPTIGSNPDQTAIDWVKAEYASIRGPIAVAWRNGADQFQLDLTIPANTSAEIFLPAKSPQSITEGGRPLNETAGVKFLRVEGDRAVVAAGSGTYRFIVKAN
jgi:alpha-L-rhamnosidase